jgi:ABC-type nickel/cobalt efflux system permease component RcnA
MTVLRSRPLFILVASLAVLAAALFGFGRAPAADAHPLGNFTINRYSRIEAYSDVIRVHYALDIAEIPAFQLKGDIDLDGDDAVSPAETAGYATLIAGDLASNIGLTIDGERAALVPVAGRVTFPEGQAGLDTIRVDAVFEAPTPTGPVSIDYHDGNYADRLGWKEIVVTPVAGLVLEGSPPTEDVTDALTSYPEDLLASPLDVTTASFSLDTTGAVPAPPLVLPEIRQESASRGGVGFASLIDTEHLTLTVVLLALLAAFGFGALHALEPGHGKTLVAAYFVGVKGSASQALLLGLIIASTHTVGVLAIGLIAIFGSQFILPETLYPWLSLASGLMVLALGVRLVTMRGGGRVLHRLAHLLPWKHHHAHEHIAGQADSGPPPWKSLIALGLADGLTPSPSALVVLLAAVSLDRIGLGIALIVAFSLGLSVVLAGVSLGLLYVRRVADYLRGHRLAARLPAVGAVAGSLTGEGTLGRVMPLGGALVLVAVGLVLTLRALPGAGIPV